VSALLATTTGIPITNNTVQFTVTGAHPSTGYAITNINRIATYTAIGATKGTIQ